MRSSLLLCFLTAVLLGGMPQSASPLGSGKFPWRGLDGKTYYYYGSGGESTHTLTTWNGTTYNYVL